MSNTLDSLRKIASASNIVYPYDDEQTSSNTPKKKKSKDPKFLNDEDKPKAKRLRTDDPELILADIREKIDHDTDLDSSDFDLLMGTIDINDEDLELKNALVGMGRKYARANTVSEGDSEIDKAFATNEQYLRNLLDELNKDVANIEHDIDNVRGSGYNRNPFKTAELISAKNSLHGTRLSAIKELNSVAKVKFELKAKSEKNVSSTNDSAVSSDIMQQLFSRGHSALLEDVGGREDVSGAITSEDDIITSDGADTIGEQYCDAYERSRESSEGDLYLKYEDQKIDIIAEYNTESHEYSLYAEDEEGNVVSDYPIPDNVNELQFDVNYRNNTAIDQLQRRYQYREV